MAAGEGEDGGLRVGPYVRDAEADSAAMPAAAPVGESAAPNAVTQLLPMVVSDTASANPSVRAVAKRAAAALPMLGRDGGTAEVPQSARATVDRRRKAAAAAADAKSDPSTEKPAPALDPPAPKPVMGQPPPVRRVAPAAVSSKQDVPPAPVPTLMGQPRTAGPPPEDIVEAELVDDEPADDEPAGFSEAAAAVVSALTEVAFRDSMTDEWMTVRPGIGEEPHRDQIRGGPPVLEEDTWDTAAQPLVGQESYQGRRRANRIGTRVWVVVGLVVAAMSAAIAVPWLLTTEAGTPATQRSPGAEAPIAGGSVDSGLSSPGLSPSAEASPRPAVGASPPVTSPGGPASGDSAVVLAVEAEKGGTATAWGSGAAPVSLAGASGGSVVDKIGDWSNSLIDGWLEFRNLNLPAAGNYVLKIYYVYKATGNDNPRRLRITVNGSSLAEQTFTAVSTVSLRTVTVTLRAGSSNTIRFTHATAESPAIDKIEIAKG